MQIEELRELLETLGTGRVLPVLSEPAQAAFIKTLKNFGWKCTKNTDNTWEIADKPAGTTHSKPRPETFQALYNEALATSNWNTPDRKPLIQPESDPENFVALQLINLQAMLRPTPKSMLAPEPQTPALLLSDDAARVLNISLQNKTIAENIRKLAERNTLSEQDRNNLQANLNRQALDSINQEAFNRFFSLQANWDQPQVQSQVQARINAIQKAESMVMALPSAEQASVKQALIEGLSKQESPSKLGQQFKDTFSTKPRPTGFPF